MKNKHFQMFAERVRACELLKIQPSGVVDHVL
jgi:hypothetical protein